MTKDWDNPRPSTIIPKAKLNDVHLDGKVLHASYDGECVTLSPSQTRDEFYDEVRRLNELVNRLAELRRDHEASQQQARAS